MGDFLTFQQFETRNEAEAMASKLEEYNIPTFIEQNRELLDQNLLGKQYNNYILLKIPGEDFERAQKILIDTTKVDLAQVDKDYMLFSMTNQELMDILAKPDEWGAYNYNVALAILKQRGENVDEQKTANLQQERINKLSERRDLPEHWRIIGYGVSVIAIVASVANKWFALYILYSLYFLPGILGIIIGAMVRYTRRTLPNGTNFYSFNDNARKHGLFMMLLGILSLALILAHGLLLREPTF